MVRKDRGQVTLFIILGLLVVVAVGLTLFFVSQQARPDPRADIPAEARPVYDFVTECVRDVSTEAINLVGLHGGYVEVPDVIARTPPNYIPLDPLEVAKVPLWYFDGEPQIPTLDSMESGIADYVDANLASCTGQFEDFDFDIEPRAEPQTDVLIGEEDVTVSVDYRLDLVRADGRTAVIDEPFISFVDVQLKKAYDTAVEVMRVENEESWFENLTIDLMTAHPDIPFNGLDVSCSVKSWGLSEVRSELQDTLAFNLPAIRLENTDVAEFSASRRQYERARLPQEDFFQGRRPPEAPIDQFEYTRMRFDAGIPENDLVASFTYRPEWGLDLNGEPNDGGRLVSKVGEGPSEFLPSLCINFYHFTYDVIYPTLLTLNDADAFRGEGFTFHAAFPVIINDNTGARKTFGYREFIGFESDQGFCEELGDEVVDIRVSGLEPQLGIVPLKDANIRYACLQKVCDLGNTSADRGLYRLRTRLPDGCANPTITASKPGYLPATEQMTDDRLDLSLPRLVDLDVKVMKHNYDTTTDRLLPPKEGLGSFENVTFHLRTLDGQHQQYLRIPGDSSQLIFETTNYSAEALLTKFGQGTGGYHHSNFQIRGTDIIGKDTLVLHVVQVVPVRDTEEYQQDIALLLADEEMMDELRPELI